MESSSNLSGTAFVLGAPVFARRALTEVERHQGLATSLTTLAKS